MACCAGGTVRNGLETCVSGARVPSAALQCEDDNPCTVDQCDPVTVVRVVAVMDGTPCLDGTVCNGEETCQAGQRVLGTALTCGDTNPCTAEACDAVRGCVSVPVMNGAPVRIPTCATVLMPASRAVARRVHRWIAPTLAPLRTRLMAARCPAWMPQPQRHNRPPKTPAGARVRPCPDAEAWPWT